MRFPLAVWPLRLFYVSARANRLLWHEPEEGNCGFTHHKGTSTYYSLIVQFYVLLLLLAIPTAFIFLVRGDCKLTGVFYGHAVFLLQSRCAASEMNRPYGCGRERFLVSGIYGKLFLCT